MSNLSIPFLENKGQVAEKSVKYYAKIFSGTVFVTDSGRLVYSFVGDKGKTGWVISEQVLGTNPDAKGIKCGTAKVSFIKGKDRSKWRKGVSTYGAVSIGESRDGTRIKVKAYANNVEKLFVVPPFTDPSNIKVKVEGTKALSVNTNGELRLDTDKGIVKFTKPKAYQMVNGHKKAIRVCYDVRGNEYGFIVKDYDPSRPLIIDPLLASTFLGGTGGDIFIAKFDSTFSNLLARPFWEEAVRMMFV